MRKGRKEKISGFNNSSIPSFQGRRTKWSSFFLLFRMCLPVGERISVLDNVCVCSSAWLTASPRGIQLERTLLFTGSRTQAETRKKISISLSLNLLSGMISLSIRAVFRSFSLSREGKTGQSSKLGLSFSFRLGLIYNRKEERTRGNR